VTVRSSTDWFAVLTLFATGLAGAMHFAKVAPVMGAISAELQLSLVGAGFAVSILGIVGVVFAIGAGALVSAIGLAFGLWIALFGGAILAFAGAIAPDGLSFLGSRLLEGFSHLLIVVCSPALMAAHATERDKPVVLALWGCFFGTGFAITSEAAPAIIEAYGWRGLLAAHGVVLLLVGAATLLAIQRSGYRDSTAALPDARSLLASHVAVYRSGSPLRLALAFCTYTILFLAVLTFLGKLLPERFGWSEARAGSFIAMLSLLSLAATLTGGVLSRKGVTLLRGLATAFGIVGVASVMVFGLPLAEWPTLGALVAMFIGFGLMPGFVFSNVPSVAPTPALAALTYGAIAQFGNVGTFAGTPIFAVAYQSIGWPGIAGFVVIMCIAGMAIARTVEPAQD
jgi:predicted MFS family arabinose efflux permease